MELRPSMSKPDIDVLIPVYNAASTLDVALASIAAQTYRDIRILVVDDGSEDDSPKLLSAWAARDRRIEIVRRPNGGIVAALNTGLEHCSATYLARFDADDIAFPNRLEWQHDFLEANPACVGVGCAIQHIDEDGARLYGLPQPGAPGKGDPDWAPAREPYIVHPFLMARREAVVAVGGYRYVPNSEDSDLFWRLTEVGNLHNPEEVLGQYRIHQRSLSSASVVNGRIMAVGSQLGALSAHRRRTGQPDIRFEFQAYAELRRAETLGLMCAYAQTQLSPQEVPRFQLAVAMKLLELAAYRPFSIDHSDCAFIRRSLAHAHLFSGENRNEMRWYITETAKRLLQKKELTNALALTPPSFYARTAAKALVGLLASKPKASNASFSSPMN
jgi:glycosyltransferase involved in cell wall biosynthesis